MVVPRIDLVHQRVEAAGRAVAVPAHVDAACAGRAPSADERHVLLADHRLAVLAPLVDELGAALLLDVVVRGGGLGLGGHATVEGRRIMRHGQLIAATRSNSPSNDARLDHRIACGLPCLAAACFRGRSRRPRRGTTTSSAIAAPTATRGCVERAKQEGRVVLYTSLAPTESKPLAEAFEKKYGIKVELWRALVGAGRAARRSPRRGRGAMRVRRDRDQRPGDGDAGAREAARRVPFAAPRRPARRTPSPRTARGFPIA